MSYKLIVLLALTTSQRVQTLSKILIQNIIISDETIQIKIPGRIKTSGVNKTQPCLKLPFFQEEPKVCVASTLSEYIKRTEAIRGDVEELFITFKKPNKAASTSTLSRWIKCILTESGIDTSFFKAHSTRHASSSAAKRQGVSVDIIFQTAGWTKKSLAFTKFYDRPLLNENTFAKAVILNNNITHKSD